MITFEQIVEFITNFGSITKGAKPLNSGYLLVEEEMAVYELFVNKLFVLCILRLCSWEKW